MLAKNVACNASTRSLDISLPVFVVVVVPILGENTLIVSMYRRFSVGL